MSYSILVKEKDKIKEIPFSTKDNYTNVWLPLIEKLNLSLIGEFQFGVQLSKHECEQLILELKRARNSSISNEDLKNRIDFIINEVQSFIEMKNYESVYIG